MALFDFTGANQFATSGQIINGTLTDGGSSVAFTYTVQSGQANLSSGDIQHFGSRSTSSTFMFPISTTPSGAVISTTSSFPFPTPTTGIATLLLASGQFLSNATLNFDNMAGLANVSVRTQSGAFTALSGPGASYTGLVSGFRFTTAFGNGFDLASITSNALVCFLEGTRIETEHGPALIETLPPGTRLRTADGGLTTLKWLGRQQVDATLTHPAKTYPVRISDGALGNGLPLQDLFVSAEHALEIDGYLINAGALINGTTITQSTRKSADSYIYYHIDTGSHDLVLAEGAAAETFIDYAARDSFDNADTATASTIAEMPLPRISSARLVPSSIRTRLAPLIAAE